MARLKIKEGGVWYYTGYGESGASGYSGYSGSDFVGSSGYSGYSGVSGYSGYSGESGYSGYSGISGYSGKSGYSGYSGYSGESGYSGYSGISGYSGKSGYSGVSGYSGQGGVGALEFIIDGQGAAPSAGIKGDVEVPFACTINAATLAGDASGYVSLDIWKDSYANYPPTVADSIITASGTALGYSGDIKYQDATLTNWNKSIAAGDVIRYNVNGASGSTRVLVSLKVTKT